MTANLPPLPPLPDEAAAAYVPTGQNILDVLADDHHKILQLSAELADDTSTTPQRRKELAEVVTAMVSRHVSAEEQYLYPAIRDLFPDGDDLAKQELAQTNSMLRTLSSLKNETPDADAFRELAATIDADVRRHTRTASREIHPRMRELATQEELVRLGNRVEIAAEAAPSRPHPNTPATPPWNKVVDPMMGAADKVRDALSARPTHPDHMSNPGQPDDD
jgi:hemerythrin superfamily protein